MGVERFPRGRHADPERLCGGQDTVCANQLEFVNLIVTHLTERGVIDPALLYEPPFTSYAQQGPDALFTSAQVDELFGVLEHIKTTALAA